MESPFRVSNRKPSPHNIDLAKTAPVPDEFRTDPMVAALSPIPKQDGGVFATHEVDNWSPAYTLTKLCSPTSIVRTLWSLNQELMLRELSLTNVAPLVVNFIAPRDQKKLDSLVELALHMPRKLVLVCKQRVTLRPAIQVVAGTGFYNRPDLERIGAMMLREWMNAPQDTARLSDR
jgi:hypothetical protein